MESLPALKQLRVKASQFTGQQLQAAEVTPRSGKTIQTLPLKPVTTGMLWWGPSMT